MFKLKPRQSRFYDQFDAIADVMVEATKKFLEYLETSGDPEVYTRAIRDLEHKADQVVHETMNMLHKTFITPLERGDIRRLVKVIDNVVDHVDSSMSRISLYGIKEPLPKTVELGKRLHAAAEILRTTVREIRTMKKTTAILRHCGQVIQLEDEGDGIFLSQLADLFNSKMDALTVIKWKEIIEDMEGAMDSCEDVANVLEGIVVEHG